MRGGVSKKEMMKWKTDSWAGSSKPKERSSSEKHRKSYQVTILLLEYGCTWKPIEKDSKVVSFGGAKQLFWEINFLTVIFFIINQGV